MNCPITKCKGAKLRAMRTDAFNSYIVRTRRCPECQTNYQTTELLSSDLDQVGKDKKASELKYDDLMNDLRIFSRVIDHFKEEN